MKVAVTCHQLIRDIEALRNRFDEADLELVVAKVPGQHLEGEELVEALEGCIGVIAGDDQFTEAVMTQLSELKVISKWGVGIDGIDRDAAKRLGITVRNTPGMFDDEVADISLAYVIMLHRELVQIDRRVRSGSWYKPAGTSSAGQTLGIIGLGGIGRALAKRATLLAMKVLGTDPSPESQRLALQSGAEVVELDTLLSKADIISINCPLNPSTRKMFNAETLGLCKNGVHIVNTGRGAVVDTDALYQALVSGKVKSAALDVLEEEPLNTNHPIANLDQVVFGSHNASNTLQASMRTHHRAFDNLLEELEKIGNCSDGKA